MKEKEEVNTEGEDTDIEETEPKSKLTFGWKYEQLDLFDEDQVAPI